MAWTSMIFPPIFLEKKRQRNCGGKKKQHENKNTWDLFFWRRRAPAFQTRGFPKAPRNNHLTGLCALSAKSARKVDIGSMPQKNSRHRKNISKDMSQRMLPSPFKMVHFSAKLMAFNAQVETHHDTVYIHIYTYNIIQLSSYICWPSFAISYRKRTLDVQGASPFRKGLWHSDCSGCVEWCETVAAGCWPTSLCVQKDVHKLA